MSWAEKGNGCGFDHVIIIGAVCEITRVGVAWVGLLGYFPARARSPAPPPIPVLMEVCACDSACVHGAI